MSLGGIFISAFLIGFSGAMMPGPLLGVTIDGSMKRGFAAGPLAVLGHGILEIVLIIIMLFGLRDFFANPTAAGFIGLFGGIYLGWMGYGMIKAGIRKEISLESKQKAPQAGSRLVLAGALVSATNPYFILWWASTGMESVRQSYVLGLTGIALFFIGHILADLTWYSAVSFAFSKGKKVFSDAVYQRLILILGLFILVFSTYFLVSGWKLLFVS